MQYLSACIINKYLQLDLLSVELRTGLRRVYEHNVLAHIDFMVSMHLLGSRKSAHGQLRGCADGRMAIVHMKYGCLIVRISRGCVISTK